MSKGGLAVLVVAAVVFAALGFVFGQVVQAANSNVPGAVVTETYVQQYVGEMLADMQSKLDEFDMRLYELSGGVPVSNTEPPEPSDDIGAPANPNTPSTPQPSKVKIKSNGVNVRSEASTTASIVGGVTINTEITYLGQITDSQGQVWYNVRLDNGTEGWVAGWLCYDPE